MQLNLKSALHFLSVLIIVSIASMIYWILYNKPMDGVDDANIYFVYIKNLAEGNGFVYNAGAERVEGFTSLLWVLILTPCYFLSHDYEHYILFANILLISVLFYGCLRFLQKIASQKQFFSVPAILFLTFAILIPGYIDWNILSLMETSIWGFLLVFTTILLCGQFNLKRKILFSICLGLLLLTRPESILWVFVFVGLLIAKQWLETKSFRKAIGYAIVPVAASILVVATLTLFRINYFGFPLPNTYYAKVSSDWMYNIKTGLFYLMLCFIQSPYLLLILLSAIFTYIYLLVIKVRQYKTTRTITADNAETTQFIITTVSMISLMIPVWVGGDHFALLRGIQPFVPVYLLGLFHLDFWRKLVTGNLKISVSRPLAIGITLAFVPVICFFSRTPIFSFRHGGSPLINEFVLGDDGREEGQKMNRLLAPMGSLPKVGVSAAGGFKYGYDGFVIDLMGLNNVTMAHANKIKTGLKNHAAFDKRVFFEQSPELFHASPTTSLFVEDSSDSVLLENQREFRDLYVYKMYKSIFDEERFKNEYAPVMICNDAEKLYLKTYARKDYIGKLNAKGIKTIILERHFPG